MLKESEELYIDVMGKEMAVIAHFVNLGEGEIEINRLVLNDYRCEDLVDISPLLLNFGDEIEAKIKEARQHG